MLVTQPVKNLTATSDEMSEKKKERKHLVHVFFESRQQTDSFWGCTKTLQTPNNPIRRPTGSCGDCFQNVRVQRESDAGWKYSHRFFFFSLFFFFCCLIKHEQTGVWLPSSFS